MLLGVNVRLILKLQMVQTLALRLITRQRCCHHHHITPSLISLHRLQVRWRINYKILLLTYRALHDLVPAYIVDIISPYTPGRLLRPPTATYYLHHVMIWNGLVDVTTIDRYIISVSLTHSNCYTLKLKLNTPF